MVSYEFVPRFFYINAITRGQTTTVQFTEDHDYTDGEIISFRVSPPYGMFEMNNKQARVLSHTADTVTVEIDSLNFNAFIYPVSGLNTPPVAVPAGSGIIPSSDPPTMNLEDCFDNTRTD